MHPHPFRVPVEQLRDRPLEIQIDAEPRELELEDEEFEFEAPVRGAITFYLVGKDVIGNGELSTSVRSRCVRCLEPASQKITIAVNETWMPASEQAERAEDPEAEEVVNFYSGDFIETGEVLREVVMAGLPDRVYCRDECRGLCPGCGVNLNLEPCQCPDDMREAREQARLPEWKQRLRELRGQES